MKLFPFAHAFVLPNLTNFYLIVKDAVTTGKNTVFIDHLVNKGFPILIKNHYMGWKRTLLLLDCNCTLLFYVFTGSKLRFLLYIQKISHL